MQTKLKPHIPHLRLFVTYKPLPNIRKVWQRLALNTLRRSGEGGWEDNFFHRDLSGNDSFTPDLTACDLLLVARANQFCWEHMRVAIGLVRVALLNRLSIFCCWRLYITVICLFVLV